MRQCLKKHGGDNKNVAVKVNQVSPGVNYYRGSQSYDAVDDTGPTNTLIVVKKQSNNIVNVLFYPLTH